MKPTTWIIALIVGVFGTMVLTLIFAVYYKSGLVPSADTIPLILNFCLTVLTTIAAIAGSNKINKMMKEGEDE